MEGICCFLVSLAYSYKITTDHFPRNHSKYVTTLKMNIIISSYHRKGFQSHYGISERKLIFLHGVCHVKGKGPMRMVLICGQC